MAREKAHRKYQLTINNPLELGFSHEVIRSNLEALPRCLYWCMVDEVGDSGNLHTHVYLACKNAIMFSTILNRFHGAHIEVCRGSHQQNRDYILKQGTPANEAKQHTSVPGTFEESGPLPEETDQRLQVNEAILAMIQDGASNAEILEAYPTAMNRLQHIEAARQTLLAEKYKNEFRRLEVHYIWGKTRVGKTRYVMEKYGYDNVYRVTSYQHPFDSYQGQPVILFDEFRSSLPLTDLLKYLEGYPVMLPCRYADKVACFTQVYIISNIPLSEQYRNIQTEEPESWLAFKARFTEVYEMLSDGTPVPFEGVESC